MNYRKVLLILAVLLLLPFALKVRSEDFGRNQSLFTDIKAHSVGDILTVHIFEQTRASSEVETNNEKIVEYSTRGGPGIGPLRFVPLFGVSGDATSTHEGLGENLRNGSLRAKMSVTVVALKPNGDLVVEGHRTVGISGERETLTLTGVVRSKDVTADNTIASHLIADAEIHYDGTGPSSTTARPGFVTRFINWLF